MGVVRLSPAERAFLAEHEAELREEDERVERAWRWVMSREQSELSAYSGRWIAVCGESVVGVDDSHEHLVCQEPAVPGTIVIRVDGDGRPTLA
jgi:hypothetical protein